MRPPMMTALTKGLRCLAPLGGARHFTIAASQIACSLFICIGSSQEVFISVISFRFDSNGDQLKSDINFFHGVGPAKYML